MLKNPDSKYALGSVLDAVLLHQTVIGLEAEKQLAGLGVEPDIVIGCVGGGSNFSGISFPFVRKNLIAGKHISSPSSPYPAPRSRAATCVMTMATAPA